MIEKHFPGFRLLLLADGSSGAPLRSLLAEGPLAGWEVVVAESFAHTRFIQQWDPCDMVLVDHTEVEETAPDDLHCLSLPKRTPMVVLSDTTPPEPDRSGRQPRSHWLPRKTVLEQPGILSVVLEQAVQLSEMDCLLQQREESLRDCRRQVDRLADLLWQSTPTQRPVPWFTQRHMMERLGEEVTRSKRYGDLLSVVVGELTDSPRQAVDLLDPCDLAGWMARQFCRHKRHCDVAGQYGPQGFLLLLPQTSELSAGHCCQRLLPLLENSNDLPEGAKAPPSVRVGIAGLAGSSTTASNLLARAEERLQQARLTVHPHRSGEDGRETTTTGPPDGSPPQEWGSN